MGYWQNKTSTWKAINQAKEMAPPPHHAPNNPLSLPAEG